MLRLSAGDCRLSVPVTMPVTLAVAQFVTGTVTGAMVMVSCRLFQLSSGWLAQSVDEVEARCSAPKLFQPELKVGVFAIAVPTRRYEGVLLLMLGQRVLLTDGDRPMPFGVPTRRIAFDDAGLSAVQQPVAVGTLQTDADPLGQQERQHGSDEYGDPQEVRHRVQRNVELGGDQVVAAAEPEHRVGRHGRDTEPGPGRIVARAIKQVMFGLVARHPRLDERIQRHAAEQQGHRYATKAGTRSTTTLSIRYATPSPAQA